MVHSKMKRNFILLASSTLLLSGCSLFQRKTESAQGSATTEIKAEPAKATDKQNEEYQIVLKGAPQKSEGTPSAQAAPPAPSTTPQLKWSYSGPTSPLFWGDLDSMYGICKTGKRQSPIDLRFKKPTSKKDIKMSYQPSLWRVSFNGLTVRVELSKGNTMSLNGLNYELKEIIFHTPSEHTLSGRTQDGEIQFFHRAATGEIAVVSSFLKKSEYDSSTLQSILDKAPLAMGPAIEVTDSKIDPSQLLPKLKTHYEYTGSLSFPPCSEGIQWVVFNTPIAVSEAQLSNLEGRLKDNNRPVQPLNDREVQNY